MSNEQRSDNDYWNEAQSLPSHVHHNIATGKKIKKNRKPVTPKKGGGGKKGGNVAGVLIALLLGSALLWHFASAYNAGVSDTKLDRAPTHLPSVND